MIIGLSMKERDQLVTFSKLKEGEITQVAAAKRLGLSVRWVREKLKRFIEKGISGIVHRNRGKPSSRCWDATQKAYAMSLFDKDFHDFGPTFAAEKLQELYGIKISREALRKAMIAHGYWHGRKRKMKHRKWRERKEFYGMLIQLDGSPHDWFGRGSKHTLLVFIDDATSAIVWAELVPSESTEALMQATRRYVEKCGRPLAFYTDFGSVFSVNTNNPDRIKITQFERACSELDIDIIHAHSPQAKGRVERSNQTHQDRLVKELRLRNISTLAEANKFIAEMYISRHNKAFAVKATRKGDVHRPITTQNLDNIFCIKEKRLIRNDFTIQYKNRLIQLLAEQRAVIRPKENVVIHEHFDGSLFIFIRNIQLNFIEIDHRPVKLHESILRQPVAHKPTSNHPWRRSYKHLVPALSNGGY
jgi:DNA-binding Lrp family transcriptional regulator